MLTLISDILASSTTEQANDRSYFRQNLQGQGNQWPLFLLVAGCSSMAAGVQGQGEVLMFCVADDPNNLGNGDLAIRSDKGRLAVLIYARQSKEETVRYAQVVAEALNSAFSPRHTDLMIPPEEISAYLAAELP